MFSFSPCLIQAKHFSGSRFSCSLFKEKKNRQSLDRASLNLELQHPPIWSWAFDCHPSPEDGKFEPCLGGVGIFEPTEYTCLFYFKPKIIILNMEEEENILHVSHTLKLL